MDSIESEKIAFREAYEALRKAISSDLVGCAILLQRLLGAVDLFPDGGLHAGHYAEQAIRRYWLLWMPLLHKQQQEQQQEGPLAASNSAHLIIPPLDIQWAWYVHRLNPIKYLADCTAAFGAPVHPIDGPQALGFVAASSVPKHKRTHQNQQGQKQQEQEKGAQQEGEATWLLWEKRAELTRQVWEEAYPSGLGQPPEHQLWPPAPPPSAHLPTPQLIQTHTACIQTQPSPDGAGPHMTAPASSCVQHAGEQTRTADAADTDTATDGHAAVVAPIAGSLDSVRSYVLDAMRRQSIFLHQVLRSPYTDRTFLEGGRTRYFRFLALAATRHPNDPWLVPMYDNDLLWHAHLALSGAYSADCGELIPPKPASVTTTMAELGEVVEVKVEQNARMLGHDDGLEGPVLIQGSQATIQRYEALTGLVYNVGPTRRLATEQAHPLVSRLWPLVAVLTAVSKGHTQAPTATTTITASGKVPTATSGPPPSPTFRQASSLPTPRRIASELAATMMTPLRQRRPQQNAWAKSSFTSRLKLRLPRMARTSATRGNRNTNNGMMQAFLGSPDHLSRSGVFALYGLWCLERGLEGGEAAMVAATATAAEVQQEMHCGAEAGGGGSGESGVGSSTNGFVSRAALALSRGVAKLRYGGRAAGTERAAWEATVDAAVSYMTQQMLLLADPAHPTSPLLSSLHTFWTDLMPLVPPPQPTNPHALQPPDLLSSCSSSTPPLPALLPSPPSLSGPGRPRLPAPPPSLDLPAEYFPMVSRNVPGVYLAATHCSATSWVAYTPSDFCVLGRGRWCLPPGLVEDIVEEEVREAAVSNLYEDGINPYYNNNTNNYDTRCRHDETGKTGFHGCGTAALSSAAIGNEVGAGRGGLRFRPVGPGHHPDNVLGEVVFSKSWRRRLARCYGVIYREMINRGRVAG